MADIIGANVQLFTGKRTDDLGIVKYETRIMPTAEGLVQVHEAVVFPKGGHEAETREITFTIPVAQQDDLDLLFKRWKTAIEQLRESYARTGRLVSLDIRIPLFIAAKGQGQIKQSLKEWLAEDSAPQESHG